MFVTDNTIPNVPAKVLPRNLFLCYVYGGHLVMKFGGFGCGWNWLSNYEFGCVTKVTCCPGGLTGDSDH